MLAGSTPGVMIPPIGKIPGVMAVPTPNMISRIMPSQNSGIA